MVRSALEVWNGQSNKSYEGCHCWHFDSPEAKSMFLEVRSDTDGKSVTF